MSVPRHYDIVGQGGKLTIPKHRTFHFSQLCLTPAYYSQKAAQLDLDSKGELNSIVQFTIRANFAANPSLYRRNGLPTEEELRWEHGGGIINENIKSFNRFFEATSKPTGLRSAPCFIDWIDDRWDLPTDDEYFQVPIDFVNLVLSSEIDYYTEREGEDPSDALEESARGVWNANNFAFPTTAIDDDMFLQNFRLRIHVAPNTNVQFSSNVLLTLLGFTQRQIGARGRYNRFYINNPSLEEYFVVVAENAPLRSTLIRTNDKVNMGIMTKTWVSRAVTSKMTLGNYRKNEEVQKVIDETLDEISLETNIELGLMFDETSKKFQFSFPDNANLEVGLTITKDLAHRLGFGTGVTSITRTSKADAQRDAALTENAESLAKTLVYDTGMVLVTHDSLGSMLTMGMSEFFMGCLWPATDGTLALKTTVDTSPAIYLPSSGANSANVHFNLWVYNDDGSTRKLEWKIGSYLSGILRGRVTGGV